MEIARVCRRICDHEQHHTSLLAMNIGALQPQSLVYCCRQAYLVLPLKEPSLFLWLDVEI